MSWYKDYKREWKEIIEITKKVRYNETKKQRKLFFGLFRSGGS